KDEIDQAIARVLNSGWDILGNEVKSFEQEFADYLGVKYVIGVASGTEAIYLALSACGIGSGDAVVTVSHTAVATISAIELSGATPILIDIDPLTFTMNPDLLEKAVRKNGKVKAVIPVHLYGHPADMPSILDIAKRYGLYVIEDCAQSHGASIQGRKTGNWGNISAFSFYPTKNLGAFGDGGAVATNDKDLSEKVQLLREYGWRERYISYTFGINSRLDEIQAAILRVKLKYLDQENYRRKKIAEMYNTFLRITDLKLPFVRENFDHVYHQFVVRHRLREDLRNFLKNRGIHTLIHYPVPIHLQPAYKGKVMVPDEGLEQTEQICQEILSLPIYPYITDEQVKRVCKTIILW
ncbi:MAG: DegT/DnrJ/EryC1/StrS family aminotransferase, partial [Chitinophagaceae bacterium]|nr:DegT/DnrJ/EryC1/StrS family aminotransferase [Chitinophagaceae bacterium]